MVEGHIFEMRTYTCTTIQGGELMLLKYKIITRLKGKQRLMAIIVAQIQICCFRWLVQRMCWNFQYFSRILQKYCWCPVLRFVLEFRCFKETLQKYIWIFFFFRRKLVRRLENSFINMFNSFLNFLHPPTVIWKSYLIS